MQRLGLLVCTTCFGLTSAGQGMQVCRCEIYTPYPGVDCPSGYHLCQLCAALLAGGTGRYSWHVCEFCLKFNRKLAKDYGFSLPLGRHSIMNGLGIPFSASDEVRDAVVADLLRSFDTAAALADWGTLQARVLFESVPAWKREPFILLSTWQAKFARSKVKATARSVAAFKGYLRVESFG